MATFTGKPTATIWAQDTKGEFYSVSGVTPDVSTDAAAVAQLNKIFAAIGKTIIADDMQLIITKEAN